MTASPARKKKVTPFQWDLFMQESRASTSTKARTPKLSRKAKLSPKEREERILARRWGNPYSKPGSASVKF